MNGETVELRTDYGSLVRVITNKALYAEINPQETMVLVTRTDGAVDLVDTYGAMIRNIVMSKATLARFNGTEIAVTKDNGPIEIRDISGAMLRLV